MKKSKMGRPPLPEGEAKTVLVAVKVSEVDYDKIQAAVKRSGLSEAEWLRGALVTAAER